LYAPEERLVTDRIATFTERGIGLESGRELEADITVTATGVNLLAFGGITLTVNGEPANLSDKVAKGVMLDGVPNFRFCDRLHQFIVDPEGRPGV
jgi:monooxygenase